MLKARTSNGVFILGIDAENVKRLMNNKPILVSLAELGGKDDVMIMYGDTLEDIAKELERSTGSKLPPASDVNKLRKTQ